MIETFAGAWVGAAVVAAAVVVAVVVAGAPGVADPPQAETIRIAMIASAGIRNRMSSSFYVRYMVTG
jgi:hypothetical protein